MSETFYRKYRPSRFADVLGQERIVRTITTSLAKNRVGQAYLFNGPRGTGKTTTARLLAKALTCANRQDGFEPCLECPHCVAVAEGKSLDIIEIDAASNTGVDNIRELRDSIRLLPAQAPFKVYIIDEVHMLSIGAWNALLKTLEEPPKHVVFILATTALHKVPDTVLSRCQRFDFSKLPLDRMIEKLSLIAKREHIDIEPKALEIVALAAQGGMRDAESLFAQVAATESKHITAESAALALGITNDSSVEDFLDALATRDIAQTLSILKQTTDTGIDPFVFADTILAALRRNMLAAADTKLAERLSQEMTQETFDRYVQRSKSFSLSEFVHAIELFQDARNRVRTSPIAELPLEIAVVKLISKNFTEIPASVATPTALPKPTPRATQAPVKQTATTTPQQQEAFTQETLSNETSSISLSEALAQWPAIVNQVRASKSALALTLSNNARIVSVSGNVVTIGTKFPIYRDKINDVDAKLTLEQAFDTILKVKIKVEVVLESDNQTNNPLLDDAVSILGGEIV